MSTVGLALTADFRISTDGSGSGASKADEDAWGAASDSVKSPAEKIELEFQKGDITREQALEKLESDGLVSFSSKNEDYDEGLANQYSDRIKFSILDNLESSSDFRDKFFQGLKDGNKYLFGVRRDGMMPDSDFTEKMTAGRVIEFNYSENLVHVNFARQNEYSDGMNQREFRAKLIDDQFADGIPGAEDKAQTPEEAEKVLKNSKSSGESIVDALSSSGKLSFSGRNSEKVRDVLSGLIDKSQLFRKSFTEGFLQDPGKSIALSTSNLDAITKGYAGREAGRDIIVLDAHELNSVSDNDRITVGHEFLHAAAGVRDSVDMEMATAVMLDDLGMDPEKATGAGTDVEEYDVEGFDYDFYLAARKDFESAGALRTKDYYDFETPEAKKGLEKVLGRPLNDDDSLRKWFNSSSNSHEGDVKKIVESYVHSLDGGEVEKLRAEQLKDLGYGYLLAVPKSSLGSDF